MSQLQLREGNHSHKTPCEATMENKIQFKKSCSAEKQSPEAECNMEKRKCSPGELSTRAAIGTLLISPSEKG